MVERCPPGGETARARQSATAMLSRMISWPEVVRSMSCAPNDPVFLVAQVVPQHNGGRQLAHAKVLTFVSPTCLLGRQKSLGNLRKKKHC